jgi:hypothetical protein
MMSRVGLDSGQCRTKQVQHDANMSQLANQPTSGTGAVLRAYTITFAPWTASDAAFGNAMIKARPYSCHTKCPNYLRAADALRLRDKFAHILVQIRVQLQPTSKSRRLRVSLSAS